MFRRRTISSRTIFAVCFCALMTTAGIAAVSGAVQKFSQKRKAGENSSPSAAVVRTFRKQYPFTGGDGRKNSAAVPLCPRFPFKNCIQQGTDLVDEYATRQNPLSGYFYHICAFIDTFFGNKVIENGSNSIVRLPNGYLTYVYSQPQKSWETVLEWNSWLTKRNIPLLQLIPATKMDDRITVFPPVVRCGYARTMKRYMAFLSENHIPYLDAKDVLLAANNDFYSWFYKTDHHWNVFAGRLIAEATARKLNDTFKIAADADAVKEEKFKLKCYPSIFMGSMALKAGAAPEDFEVFFSRKESRFQLKIPNREIDRVGGFNDTLIAQTYLKSPWMYSCFLYGDPPLIQIENKDCTNGTRVLVVKHSQANVVCTYLACAVQYLDIIDPRHFDGSIKSFIEQTRPDAVLTCI